MKDNPPVQRTILIVDDEQAIIALLHEVLSDAGYRVLTARNGREALTCLEQEHADLILSDVMMPVMDGPALHQAMQRQPAFRSIPFIMMSAVAAFNTTIRENTDTLLLPKPFDLDVLLNTIDERIAA